MKLHVFVISALLLLSAACEEVSSNRGKRPAPTPNPTPNPSTGALTVPSGMIRTRGTTGVTYTQEIAGATRTDGNFRNVPDMQIDDEGKFPTTAVSRTNLKRPTDQCGLTPKQSVKARINDCAKVNAKKATWDGVANASSTEGRWDLVALKKSGTSTKEIWMDRKTGMLWSDVYAATNWCEAAGNDQNSLRDELGVNCMDLVKEKTCIDRNLLDISDITWRLPTRNDYLQGELDGLRFVLAEGDGNGFWTATMSSASALRDQAWTFNSDKYGMLETDLLTNKHQVRCIGVSNI